METILAQRNYIITTMKILCTKITTIVRLVDEYYISSTIGDINWVSKFKTRSKNDIIDWNIRWKLYWKIPSKWKINWGQNKQINK